MPLARPNQPINASKALEPSRRLSGPSDPLPYKYSLVSIPSLSRLDDTPRVHNRTFLSLVSTNKHALCLVVHTPALPLPCSTPPLSKLDSANSRAIMPAVVSNATRIWELNIHWELFAQCAVWDLKRKGVDIWECIRARTSILAFHPHPALIECHYRPLYSRDSSQFVASLPCSMAPLY